MPMCGSLGCSFSPKRSRARPASHARPVLFSELCARSPVPATAMLKVESKQIKPARVASIKTMTLQPKFIDTQWDQTRPDSPCQVVICGFPIALLLGHWRVTITACQHVKEKTVPVTLQTSPNDSEQPPCWNGSHTNLKISRFLLKWAEAASTERRAEGSCHAGSTHEVAMDLGCSQA